MSFLSVFILHEKQKLALKPELKLAHTDCKFFTSEITLALQDLTQGWGKKVLEQNYPQGRITITLNQDKLLSVSVASAMIKTTFIHLRTILP